MTDDTLTPKRFAAACHHQRRSKCGRASKVVRLSQSPTSAPGRLTHASYAMGIRLRFTTLGKRSKQALRRRLCESCRAVTLSLLVCHLEQKMTSFFSLSGSFEKTLNDGRPEMASPGLHDHIYGILSDLVDVPFHAVDFGAGSGAWGQRLIANGNSAIGVVLESDMASCDLEKIEADLSHPFAEKFDKKFDVVTCIEVLEHIENPRNAFREARKLLKSGGIFLISTPNASGIYSRLKFFVTGRFGMFDDIQYHGIGHITPLTHWQIEKMFSENDFDTIVIEDFDATPKKIRSIGDIIKRAVWLLRPFMRGHVGTQHIIAVGRAR
jgi:SAM-dependent methyltransferase